METMKLGKLETKINAMIEKAMIARHLQFDAETTLNQKYALRRHKVTVCTPSFNVERAIAVFINNHS
jgi:hypothetical protein